MPTIQASVKPTIKLDEQQPLVLINRKIEQHVAKDAPQYLSSNAHNGGAYNAMSYDATSYQLYAKVDNLEGRELLKTGIKPNSYLIFDDNQQLRIVDEETFHNGPNYVSPINQDAINLQQYTKEIVDVTFANHCKLGLPSDIIYSYDLDELKRLTASYQRLIEGIDASKKALDENDIVINSPVLNDILVKELVVFKLVHNYYQSVVNALSNV